jgi:uncharacterized membrane protein
MKYAANNFAHKSFELGLLIKGFDSLFEVIGGISLILLNPIRLNRLITLLTRHELSEDPKDIIAGFIITIGSKYTTGTQFFGALYLISHGIVRMSLVVLLWKRKIWAYPVSILTLILFIFYQLYRYTLSGSEWLIVLSAFDMIMILLTYTEYKKIKHKLNPTDPV